MASRYFNWRKDTFSDLQLFLAFNVGLFLVGAAIEGALLRGLDGTGVPADGDHPQWWLDLYAVRRQRCRQLMLGCGTWLGVLAWLLGSDSNWQALLQKLCGQPKEGDLCNLCTSCITGLLPAAPT